MQRTLNLRVKYRESFRPFAPSVLKDNVSEWFELEGDSPYMLIVADVVRSRRREMTQAEAALFGIDKLNVSRSEIPAVTHVDYSARVQTVDEPRHGRYYRLIREFKRQTGCGVIVNTSFNIRGEPIVGTPQDAYRCFLACDMDVLVLEDCVLYKTEQPQLSATERAQYVESFTLD